VNVDQIFEELSAKLGRWMPESEIRKKAELAFRINQLKKERNAVILGHNYMEPALFHSIPDFTGDSLELARLAAQTDKDIIVFCGVKFMAETAKILNPQKTVLLPALNAGCSLAESITAEDVRNLKRKFPDVPVVTYVNTYADVKAESDVCCTSGNAAKVVESLKNDTIIFLPDEYLARNVARQTGKHIIFPSKSKGWPEAPMDTLLDYQFIGWHGRCEVHELFTVGDVEDAREKYPGVVVMAHPECSPEVTQAADFAGSTSAMIKFVQENKAPSYLLLTEGSMADNIAGLYPEKNILRIKGHRCPHMQQITLEDTLLALQKNQFVIDVEESVRLRAKRAVQRMIEIV